MPLLVLLPALLSPALTAQNKAQRYQNTVYLPYYRLPRGSRTGQALELSSHDPETFLNSGGLYSGEVVSSFQEYLLAALASGRVTQINYFRLRPGEAGDGSIDFSGFYPEHMEYLHKLRRAYGFRLVICLAGGSSRYLPVMETAGARQKLAQNIVDFVGKWQLDGVDFDWEYPRNKQDMAAYVALIREVRQGIKKNAEERDLRVSVAVSRSQVALTGELFENVDEVNFMAYDFAPRHSTMEDAAEMVEYLRARFNIPSRKIFLGLPFYGREIKADGRRTARAYGLLSQDFDLASQDNEVGNYYFNGQDMVKEKFDFVQNENLGGLMIWEIGQDSKDHRSLLRILPRQK